MRTPYAIALTLAVLIGGTYWFAHVAATCDLPITYRIGEVDERFGMSFEEARLALVDAEAVWENATGENLFSYEEDAAFTVNFVFDERQALADAEQNLRERLDAAEGISDAISETHAALIEEYESLSVAYETRIAAYEADLAAYNADVESYNEAGGAPPEVYEEFEARKMALDTEQTAINDLADRLNELVTEINRIGEQGNRLIDVHNQHVERYNDTFAGEREFTQGDYTQNNINIYTFTDREELVTVLAHELGHALRLGHVENEASVMYHLMGGQTEPLALTPEDIAAFEAVCSDRDAFETIAHWRDRLVALIAG